MLYSYSYLYTSDYNTGWYGCTKNVSTCNVDRHHRGVGTGPAGPATAGPMFPEPTIKNIIPLFVIKQIKNCYITAAYLYHFILKELHYYIIERTRYQFSSSNNFVTN